MDVITTAATVCNPACAAAAASAISTTGYAIVTGVVSIASVGAAAAIKKIYSTDEPSLNNVKIHNDTDTVKDKNDHNFL